MTENSKLPRTNTPKVTPDIREYILKRLSMYHKAGQIAKGVEDKFGVKIATQTVVNYSVGKIHQPVLIALRQTWLKSFGDVAGFQKRVRLERLEDLYERAHKRADYYECRRLVDQMLKESEGQKTAIENVNLQFNQMNISDSEIERKRTELLKKIKDIPTIREWLKEEQNGTSRIQEQIKSRPDPSLEDA